MEKDYIFYGLFLKDEDKKSSYKLYFLIIKSLPHVDNFILRKLYIIALFSRRK